MSITSGCSITIGLASTSGHGHFRPLFGLGRRLINYGGPRVKVLFSIACSNDTVLPAEEFPEIEIHRMDIGEASNLDPMSQFIHTVENKTHYADLALKVFQAANVNCVLYDPGANWGLSVAAAMNIKAYCISTSPLACIWLWLGGFGASKGNDSDWVTPGESSPSILIPSLGNMSLSLLPDIRKFPPIVFEEGAKAIKGAQGMICNDSGIQPQIEDLVCAIQKTYFNNGNLHLLGYFADEGIRLQLAPEIEWLNQQKKESVIYIALGSTWPIELADVAELAEGLAETGAPFLWGLRDPVPCPIIATDEEPRKPEMPITQNGLPVGFLERVKDRCYVAPWVNQTQILSHPAIAMFVTHCGWNSLTESIRLCGKPLGLLPLGAEQYLNSWTVESVWKIGLHIGSPCPKKRQLERYNVADTLNSIRNNQTFVDNAKRMHLDHIEHEQCNLQKNYIKLLSELSDPEFNQ